jgi:hypothetical protein
MWALEENVFLNRPIRKKQLPVAAMFVNESGRNEQSLWRTFHRCFLPSFSSFGLGLYTHDIYLCLPPDFSGVRVAQPLGICVVFCRSLFALFVHFLYAFVLSVLLRFTPSDGKSSHCLWQGELMISKNIRHCQKENHRIRENIDLEKFEDYKGVIRNVNRRRTDNTKA